ncbi:MAG: hypothetical protein K9L22_12225 [Methylococcaceae bacterium]|nr:hypothetical protein [Methylococcaceae bacterium]
MKQTAYFEDIDYHIRKALYSAKESVKICVAWINGEIYTPILTELVNRNVKVEIIYNDDPINKRNPLGNIYGANFFPIKGRHYGSLMHNKFCIIDDSILLTGSFNWSRKAKNSFENILISENDFFLIKSFLNEFEDLKNYFHGYGKHHIEKCEYDDGEYICNCNSYNLGILGYEEGQHQEAKIDIWRVCARHNHARIISRNYEMFIYSQLGLTNDFEDDYFAPYDKIRMKDELMRDRKIMSDLENYFNTNNCAKIQAIGQIVCSNTNEHLKYGADQEYEIQMTWRDMYYRKVIPSTIYDGQGDTDMIINEHR